MIGLTHFSDISYPSRHKACIHTQLGCLMASSGLESVRSAEKDNLEIPIIKDNEPLVDVTRKLSKYLHTEPCCRCFII